MFAYNLKLYYYIELEKVDLTEGEAENETRCHCHVNNLFLNVKDDWGINGGVKKVLHLTADKP